MPQLSHSKDRELIRHLPIRGGSINAESLLAVKGPVISIANIVSTSSLPDSQTVFVIRAGQNDFIDTWASTLSFKIQVTSPCLTGVYMHAFHDLIRNIRIESATGTEIERIDNVNMLNSFIADSVFGYANRSDKMFSSRVGETNSDVPQTTAGPFNTVDVKPYESTERSHLTNSILPAGYTVSEAHDVVIPLSFLSGLFRMDSLMPPQLLEGMKIIIDWEEASNVFTHNSLPVQPVFTDYFSPGTPLLNVNIGKADADFSKDNLIDPGYRLTDVEIHLDTHTVINSASVAIMKQFHSKAGLSMSFRTYTNFHNAKAVYVDDTKLTHHYEVNRAFGQASKFLGTTRHVFRDTRYKSFLPLFHLQPRDEEFKYLVEHNGKHYPRQAIAGSVGQFWDWQKSFAAYKMLSNPNRASYSDFSKHNGNGFIYDMNRTPPRFSSSNPDWEFSADNSGSTQSIDGNNRLSVMTNAPIPPPDYLQGLVPSDINATPTVAVFWSWIEHFSHLNISATGATITI
jgi:hypothetical protein